MKRTFANFMKFSGRNFPLDCEGLRDMQDNEALLSVLGNIGGDKYKLTEFSSENQWSGYVFLKTKDFPEGEVLWVERRPSTVAPRANDTLFVKTENIDIPAQGRNFSAAYTKRSLAWGLSSTGEQYAWGGFADLKTNAELATETQELKAEMARLQPTPVGGIIMWTGDTLPSEDWRICDGRPLSKESFYELYQLIGGTFGETPEAFNIPDMRTRFPVGWRSGDTDFGNIGQIGGEKEHRLIIDEMPRHRHDLIQGYHTTTRAGYPERSLHFKTLSGAINVVPMSEIGDNQPHNNLPPYFVVNYIIRAK